MFHRFPQSIRFSLSQKTLASYVGDGISTTPDDDVVLLAATEEELQDLVNRLRRVGEEYGLSVNVDKTNI